MSDYVVATADLSSWYLTLDPAKPSWRDTIDRYTKEEADAVVLSELAFDGQPFHAMTFAEFEHAYESPVPLVWCGWRQEWCLVDEEHRPWRKSPNQSLKE